MTNICSFYILLLLHLSVMELYNTIQLLLKTTTNSGEFSAATHDVFGTSINDVISLAPSLINGRESFCRNEEVSLMEAKRRVIFKNV